MFMIDKIHSKKSTFLKRCKLLVYVIFQFKFCQPLGKIIIGKTCGCAIAVNDDEDFVSVYVNSLKTDGVSSVSTTVVNLR